MCDINLLATAAAGILGVARQQRAAAEQQAQYDFLSGQQRYAAALDEQRAAMAEREGEVAEDASRARTAARLGHAQAAFAGQGGTLDGSPTDILGDMAAAGAEDALSVRYNALRQAWENRASAGAHAAQASYRARQAAGVDPAPGIARTLLA